MRPKLISSRRREIVALSPKLFLSPCPTLFPLLGASNVVSLGASNFGLLFAANVEVILLSLRPTFCPLGASNVGLLFAANVEENSYSPVFASNVVVVVGPDLAFSLLRWLGNRSFLLEN